MGAQETVQYVKSTAVNDLYKSFLSNWIDGDEQPAERSYIPLSGELHL